MRFVFLLLLSALTWAYVVFGKGPMDGSVWTVRVKSDSLLSFPHKDILIFQEGALTSVEYATRGYNPAPYHVARGGSETGDAWTAVHSRLNNGTLEWQGTVRNDRIQGTLTWRHEDGTVRHFVFSGSRRAS